MSKNEGLGEQFKDDFVPEYITILNFLIRKNEVLLAWKKLGFGTGKWNGVGGKVQLGEGNMQAAVRETREEVGVEVRENELVKVGFIRFRYKNRPDWSNNTTVYLSRNWKGEPSESIEVAPKWFDTKDPPYNYMWPDDRFWLPLVFTGKKIDACVLYEQDRNTLVGKRIKVVEYI